MNGFDLSTISAAYLGSTAINEIYLGSVKIWPAGLPIGTTYNFDYTGTVQSQELPAGTYKLQVWGAQGGSSTGTYAATGSKGGYSEGILTLTQTTTLYVFVGGAGETINSSSTSTTVVNGGWNGGGGAKPYNASSSRYSYPRAGGGATDIALVTSSMDYSSNRTNRSSESLLSRIIVAGGGGGSSYYRYSSTSYASSGTSVGGGTSGGGGSPGTQSSSIGGGEFGCGATINTTARCLTGGGGSGWYGGGVLGTSSASAQIINYNGGGSGFVNTAENAQYRPTGYTGLELDMGTTYAGDTSFPSTSTGNETGHSGNGYARITCVDGKKFIPLTFNILSDGTITWSGDSEAKIIQYRKNNGEWTSITANPSTSISVTTGDVLQFKGNNSSYGTYDGETLDTYNHFNGTASFNVRGNIMSLCGYADTLTDEAVFPYLFVGSKVVDASGLLLPTNVTECCYSWMFYNCTSLTTPPSILPATTLANWCYWGMFYGCTSLTTTPELPAETLVQGCYQIMFYGCTNLNYIKCLATDNSATNCTMSWVRYVAASGTFVAHPSADWTRGDDGIPTNWNVQPVDVPLSEQCLTFDILGDGTIGWKASSSSLTKTIQYRNNYGSWTSITSSTSGVTISVSNGDVVQFRGSNTAYGNSSYYNYFTATCNFNVKGNIMSMFSNTGFESATTIPEYYAFKGLFYGNTYLKDASALLMPATTLAVYCYYEMFRGCTSMTGVPELPATMTTNYCYYRMFYNCSNITTAPVLNASTLSNRSYYQMFYGCSKLNYIKCLATDISATSCTNGWVTNVAASGTFVKASTMSSWTTGTSGIPSGWTVQDAS